LYSEELCDLYPPPKIILFYHGATVPSGSGPPYYRGFMITLRHTLGMNPLDIWSARLRDLYLTTHNTHSRQTFIIPARFYPAILASERPKTNTSDSASHWGRP